MAPSSSSPPSKKKGWTSGNLQRISAWVYFILIVFQIPLFRIPCRSGICTTPIQVTSSQLIANEIFPTYIVKALLYPGAVVHDLVTTRTVPRWNSLLDIYNLTEIKNASPIVDLQRLEVLAGSYFSVAGALVGLISPGRMTLFGTLLVVWGLVKEGVLGKPKNVDPTQAVYVYPTVVIALACAFSSIKYNLKKTRGQVAPVAKPLKSSAKSKLK